MKNMAGLDNVRLTDAPSSRLRSGDRDPHKRRYRDMLWKWEFDYDSMVANLSNPRIE